MFADNIQNRFKDEPLVIVSPDTGGSERARCLAEKLNADLVILSKIRESIGSVYILKVEVDVKNRKCIIIDDIVDSGTTLSRATEALKKAGAREIHAYVTHAVLSNNAVNKLKQSNIDSLTTTNSIKQSDKFNGFYKLSIAETIANGIMEKKLR